MLFKQLPVGSFFFFFFFFFYFIFFFSFYISIKVIRLKTKNEISKNETLSSVSETAQALLTRLLVSSAIYLIRHD